VLKYFVVSERFGQGRDLKFAAIDATFKANSLLVSTGSNNQIKVVSYCVSTTSGPPVNFRFRDGAAGANITGDIQISNNRPPTTCIGMPVAHLFETTKGTSLYMVLSASAYVGGHITYFYENLRAA